VIDGGEGAEAFGQTFTLNHRFRHKKKKELGKQERRTEIQDLNQIPIFLLS
jgi:hypothetical protein